VLLCEVMVVDAKKELESLLAQRRLVNLYYVK